MAGLHGTTLLVRAEGLRAALGPGPALRLAVGARELACGEHTLAILDVFGHPRPLAEGLEQLRPRLTGLADWADLMATVEGMYRAGALVEPGRDSAPLPLTGWGFGNLGAHVAMLNDRRRTAAYLDAVAEVVTPGDVVVDLGTGTGILALAAARAGAAHVYAIEATRIGGLARAMFEAHGLADRITLLPGWSTRLELPRPADVLVSEIIGSEPFAERVLEFTRDAVRRMLRPGGRLIPWRLEVFGLLVGVPTAQAARWTATAGVVDRWRQWYGMDFGPLYREASRAPQLVPVPPHEARAFTALAEPVRLAGVDLAAIERLYVDATVEVPVCRAGRLDGLLVYFEAALSPTTALATAPARADDASSWACPVWILNDGPTVREGDRVRVVYRYGIGDEAHTVRLEPA
jgi:hypothetical protein